MKSALVSIGLSIGEPLLKIGVRRFKRWRRRQKLLRIKALAEGKLALCEFILVNRAMRRTRIPASFRSNVP